jgi:iron complex outermembrane recepter protein
MMNEYAARLLQAAISMTLVTSAAMAQEGNVLEEIVVTSTKRAEALKNVPISVAAFSQEKLDKQNINTFEDIARMTPGVTFSRRGSGNSHRNDISIRGISAGPGTATTGVYVDETPIQIRPDCCVSSNPYPRIFDLDRVEILRGPQGTLYGAGSEGGTIRFITPEPSLSQYNVYARAEASGTEGGDPSHELGLAVGGPIVPDKLGFRLSAYYGKDGGVVNHINRLDQRIIAKNADWNDATVVRGALKWAVTDNLTVSPAFLYQKERINDSSHYWETFSNPGKGDFNNASPVVTPTDDHFVLPSLKIDWDNGSVAIVSNTSYFDRDNINTYDDTLITSAIFAGVTSAYVPVELAHVAMPGDTYSGQKIWTQELRVQNSNPDARLNWVVGLFYQDVEQGYHYRVDAHQLVDVLNYGNDTGIAKTVEGELDVGLYQGMYILYETSTVKNEELAGYANVDFAVTDRIKLIAGLRYSHNEYKVHEFAAGPVVSSDGFYTNSSSTDKPVTPKYGVSFQADDDNLYYLTVSKGYRQGFTTNAVASRCQADLDALGVSGEAKDIKPDSVWNYEIGSKNRLLEGRLQIDSSIYRIDWTDIQSSLDLPCGNTLRTNLGKARSQGLDVSISAIVGQALTLGLAVGYADAEYTESVRGSGGTVLRPEGEPLDIAPWTVASSVQYDFDMFGRSSYVRGDHRYSSHDSTPLSTVSNVDQTIPRAPSSSNLDLRWGMEFGLLEVSLFAANVTNQHPQFNRSRSVSFAPPEQSNYRGVTVRPRTFGITTIYRF